MNLDSFKMIASVPGHRFRQTTHQILAYELDPGKTSTILLIQCRECRARIFKTIEGSPYNPTKFLKENIKEFCFCAPKERKKRRSK